MPCTRRISFKGWRYEKLRHAVGGRDQIDILKDYAAAVQAAPIFCFYNFAPSVVKLNCKRDADPMQLGCMVVPAVVVEEALRTWGCRNFRWLHIQPEAIPWRCLITCPPYNHGEHRFAQFRWPEPRSFHHERLPEALQDRLEQGSGVDLDAAERMRGAPLDQRAERTLSPRWHVVVDTGKAPDAQLPGRQLRDQAKDAWRRG